MSGTGRGVADDWQLNKSMLECSSQLFLNSHLSDVDFVFPSEEPPVSLHAHKFVLALRSPVFEVMFYGSLPAKDSVTILDNSSAAFRSLLKFIYTDRSELENCQNAIETMQAAHKYRIPLLAEISASFLENSITPDNVCAVLHEALVYDLKKLQFKCQQVIDNSASDVLRSEAFLECSEACLECILSSDNLNVEEIRIYNAVKLWAEGECGRQDLEPSGQNMRQVLGKAFFHLRLLYIPLELFSDLISQDGILTEGEVIQIFRYHTSASPENPDFVNCSRRKLKHVVMSRMQDGPKSNNAGKAWRSETIKFSVSEPVRLMSIGLLNLIIKTDIGDEYMGNNHMLSLDLTDLHVNSTGSDSDDDFLERQLRYGSSSHEFGVRSCSFAFKSREIECVNADLPKPIDLISDRWYRLDVNFYSSNRAVLNTELKGKNFYQLMGSANKSKVTSESGLKAVFQGASHGPIHSLCLLPKSKNDQ